MLEAYAEAFPQMRVAVSVWDTPSRRGGCATNFTAESALQAATLSVALPTFDKVFSRGEVGDSACLPHIFIDTADDDSPRRMARNGATARLLSSIERKIKKGDKLSRTEKGALTSSLFGWTQRAVLSVAYSVKRCYPSKKRIILPLSFLVRGVGHQNVVVIHVGGKDRRLRLHIVIYEPNGIGAFRSSSIDKKLFGVPFVRGIKRLLGKATSVDVSGVGSGIQNLLGEHTIKKLSGGGMIERWRGFPICRAVAYFVVSSYLALLRQKRDGEAPMSLRDFDRAFALILSKPRERELVQKRVLEFLRDIARWNRKNFSKKADAELRRVFANSNVESVRVYQFGSADPVVSARIPRGPSC